MLYLIRVVLSVGLLLVAALPLLLLCLARPFHRNAVYWVSRPFMWLSPLLGFRIKLSGKQHLDDLGPCVLVCNHQSTLDLVVCPAPMPRNTVTIGKKSLVWLPVFGLFYWLSGNILIDRKHSGRANDTLRQAANEMASKQLSVWMFPEGTRSYGRGLLPFKTGAFRLAKLAKVPIVPVCVADTAALVKLGRFNNGQVPVKILPPRLLTKDDDVRQVADELHQTMTATIAELTEQAKRSA
ncbi:1-acylglycerol-3-phosphate O-acyltransferase [Neiella marina]|uniref:1-acyl-sn-glycerol-3-phosphate acyltransferase n=1 Tax=Neiella holothuriorum TaxID=2870530 RepID=A0ABS7EBK3_9GAMM|nr:1-acylglycerol-3-phosphate O-acyltransferase [Neiella holothuriorum]MBW8189714.1 1-acylglycerol-3-phosphate O-acyltransferase [Neiella holothuriorum]